MREKALISNNFLVRKKHEYIALKEEIDSLEKSISNVFNDTE